MTRSRPRRSALRTAALATTLALLALTGGGSASLASVPDGAVSASVEAAEAVEAVEASDVQAVMPTVTPDDDRAIITLTRVSPTVLDGRGDVRIAGTVTAPTSGPLVGNRIDVVLGAAPLTVRDDLERWAKGAGHANGRVVATGTTPEVAAGQSVPFSIDVAESEVATGAAFAALPISLEAYQRGGTTPAGVTRTFLAWNSRIEFEPLQIAMAVPVTLDPELELFSRDEPVRQDAWERTIGPGSRVDRIIEGTKGSDVTLAVDPSVLVSGPDELAPTTGSGGPAATGATGVPSATGSTARPGGTPATGRTDSAPAPSTPPSTPPSASTRPPTAAPPTADDVTSPLVDRLVSNLRGRNLWALPYADADVAATADVDPDNPVVRDLVARSTSLGERLGEPVRGDIAWPADGLLPNGREQDLRSLFVTSAPKKPAAILVNQRAITAPSPFTPTARRVATKGTRLLGYDERLSSLLPTRTTPSATQTTQRFLAETLILLGELPGRPRSVLVAAPRDYDPDPEALRAFLRATSEGVAWLDGVEADALATDSGADRALRQQQPTSAPNPAAPAPTLTEFRLRQLAAQRDTLDRVTTVLRDGAEFERAYGELLDELASTRWRYRPSSWSALRDSVSADVRNATSAIRVVPRRGQINFLAERGNLRITVENGLNYAVEDLRLVVAPTSPRLQVVEQPGPISISAGPGALRNVNVPVHAVAAGRADVIAYLTTADGTRIGSEARIPVTTNPLDSTFYWIGGVLAGLVLLAGLVRTLLKGTSRIDEIGDLEDVVKRDKAALDRIRD